MTYEAGKILIFTKGDAFTNFVRYYHPDQLYSLAVMLGLEDIDRAGRVKLEICETIKHKMPNSDNICPPIPKDI